MQSVQRIALVALGATLVLSMGCSSSSSPKSSDSGVVSDSAVDGGLPDGTLVDGTPAFDASMTYAGEGDACRFSVQCGLRQICVDDACVRHERLDAASLDHGEWRRMTDAELDASPLYTLPSFPWSSMNYDYASASDQPKALWGPMSWMIPGLDGPEILLQTWNAKRCQFLRIGTEVRAYSISDMSCFAASGNEAGYVAIAGASTADGTNLIALFDPTGALVWKKPIADVVHQTVALAQNWGPNAQAGLITSLYFLGNTIHVAASRGTNTLVTDRAWLTNTEYKQGSYGTVFFDVGFDGTMQVRQVQGQDVIDGTKGWIVEESGHLKAVMSRQTGTGLHDVAMEVLDLETGSRTSIVDSYGHDGAYYQPSRQGFLAAMQWGSGCRQTIRETDGSVWEKVFNTASYFCELDPTELSYRIWYLSVQTPWPAIYVYTGEPAFEFADVSPGMTGPIVQGFARDGSIFVSPDMPPEYPIVSGTASVPRYGKTREFAFVADGDAHFLGWIEWSLTRKP